MGWIDYDHDAEHTWLADDEVNVGYALLAGHRGHGYVTRALELLAAYISSRTAYHSLTLLIDKEDVRSRRVADRAGFECVGEVRGQLLYKRRL